MSIKITNFQISKWGYTVAGAIMAFLIILPFVDSRVETGFSIKQIVNSKSDGVFGTLTFNGAGKNATFKSPVAVEPQNSSTVAGSGVSAPTSPNTSVSLRTMAVNAPQGSTTSGVTGGVSGASIATTAPIQAATFVYTGQSLNLSESRSKVYVRVKGTEAGKQIATLLGNADFGIIDLKSFEGLQAKNVELTDGKDFGYSIAANFEDGSVNISPNWQKWIESGTSTSATSSVSSVLSVSDGQATTSVATSTPQIPIPESLHLPENSSSSSLDDVPTDQELIALSEAFLKEHGISTEIYNKPIVDRRAFDLVKTPVANGKLGSPQAISSRMPFEQPVSVIYPLTLSNAAIFDDAFIHDSKV